MAFKTARGKKWNIFIYNLYPFASQCFQKSSVAKASESVFMWEMNKQDIKFYIFINSYSFPCNTDSYDKENYCWKRNFLFTDLE